MTGRVPVDGGAWTLEPSRPGRSDRRRLFFAALAAIVLHVLFWWAMPAGLSPAKALPVSKRGPSEVRLIFESPAAVPPKVVPPTVPVPREEPKPERLPYSKSNPAAPQEEPDKALVQSDSDQRAANKRPSDAGPADMPTVKGVRDSSDIVSGRVPDLKGEAASVVAITPTPPAAAKPAAPVSVPEVIAAAPVPAPPKPSKAKDLPLAESPDGVRPRLEGVDKAKDGSVPYAKGDRFIHVTIPDVPDAATKRARMSEGERRRLLAAATQARPQVSEKTLPVEKRSVKGSAPDKGFVAMNAKFSEYGGYVARMYEVIARRWHELNRSMAGVGQELETDLLLEFAIDPEGRVVEVTVIESTVGTIARLACTEAVRSTGDFGPWSDEMRRDLNPIERFRIHYRYVSFVPPDEE